MSSPVPELTVRPIVEELMRDFGVDWWEGLAMVWAVIEDTDWNNADDVRRTLNLALIDELAERVKALEARDAFLTEGMKRILMGQYEGATGAAADVVALQGGTDDISGKVHVPVFP